MNSTKLWTTTCTASRFGMPIGGYAFGTVTPATDLSVDLIVRERAASIAGADKRHMGLVQKSVWGTSAWSPPIC